MTKLNLNRETLRALSASDAAAVNGAARISGLACQDSVLNPCLPQTEAPGCWSGLCATGIFCPAEI